MKNLLSTALLVAAALPYFKENQELTKVFATADGNIFLPDALNRARLHAKDTGLEVQTIDRATATASTEVLEQVVIDTEANVLKNASKAAALVATHPAGPKEDVNKVPPIDAARDAQEAGTVEAVVSGKLEQVVADATAEAVVPVVVADVKPAAKPAAKKPSTKAAGK
ncbi:hypothetical protein [Hymenobacter rubripertinctus]|uniref:Uncharacterized protein n=1 Tax=Hymenobacter rubripertinctus TaxID=2029981 RepID=A0A418QMU5_9BACT|nr:hypothetical protein [Hymenobacter rubripertinctus]RIY06464.1 hypothetical protein D0T11_18665 [Hymenobacter rubripertinctus]